MAYRLGVDVGGTFTDLFLVDDDRARQWRVKTPSTPADPSDGVLAGVRAHLRRGRHRARATCATSSTARPWPRTPCSSPRARASASITTAGFGQILHLARSQTPGPLAGWIIMVKPDPPASLADTREAVERMDARGETLVPVDRDAGRGRRSATSSARASSR